MIAVAIAVIASVIAVTCGIVADSNHADSLTFLGLMVKTTAAQIFLAGAICTWALFASLWLLSVGIRRSKERSIELRMLKALHDRGLIDEDPQAPAAHAAAFPTRIAPIKAVLGAAIAGLVPHRATDANDSAMSATAQAAPPDPSDSTDSVLRPASAADSANPADSSDSTDSPDSTDSEPTIELAGLTEHADLADFAALGTSSAFGSFTTLDHIHLVAEPELGRHAESRRFYRTDPSN